ncbi:calcium-dependent secretion activator 1-like isoform X2 [Rhopilema esculentum]|uniref:calcium-dependent secretion activator 1-like isoform X2 n=1 Tax=Rhopilema esculentum TaxID=499914 RepID=UPI0031D9D91F
MIESDTDDELSGHESEKEEENEFANEEHSAQEPDRQSNTSGSFVLKNQARLGLDTGSPLLSRQNAPIIRRTSSQASIRSSKDAEYDEEAERKEKLQIYVFISRCIAYPFNAKQPTDMTRRQAKVTKQNLIAIKERFASFLDGKTNIPADEALKNAVRSYHESFLCSDRVAKMVNSGGYSSNDFREVFKANIEKRVKNLPEIEGLSKETVLSSWMAKFDAIYRGDEDQKRTPARLAATAAAELILSKDQLYEMFQTILGVRKYEHIILYNACQLDNADEQAACIRRELQSRRKALDDGAAMRKAMPKFLIKDMENSFIEEQKTIINQLMMNLEQCPVGKTGSEGKNALYKMKKAQTSAITMMDVHEDGEAVSEKFHSQTFSLQVTVSEARGLGILPPNRTVLIVMELEGGEKLQTDQAEASKPVWETHGDWTLNQPLPELRLRLLAEDSSMFALDSHKELAKFTLNPHCGMSEGYDWYRMVPSKGWNGDPIEIKVSVKFEKPQNVKKCGFLYIKGQNKWKKWKKRFCMLFQVSQYNFTLCSYRPKRAHPTEKMNMQGYTVDFAEQKHDDEHQGGRFFFRAVKEGDVVEFASDEDIDRQHWVYKLYNATGQSFKPAAPKIDNAVAASGGDTLPRPKDADRARKHGLDEVIQADPVKALHFKLFELLQRLTLLHRLNDSYTCLGWFSPGQLFVLDEYCSRYGVRGCHRHLCYLSDLLERAENGVMIDPTLLHYSYAFCASHVLGNKPDGVNTVTVDEKQRFEEIKERLRDFLANQITQFRYCFPFGRPEGALKSTLTLYERVLTKDAAAPVDPADVRSSVRNCLRKAALVNYTRLSGYARIEGADISPSEKLEKVTQLAELCIELIQQNEEHHAEALAWYSELMTEHTEIFWSLYAVDMDEVLACQPIDTWDSFVLFQMLNNYLRMEPTLCQGPFHCHLRNKFAPLVIRYIDLMESSVARSLDKTFTKETWTEVGLGCAASEEVFWKLKSLQAFIRDLHWPDEEMAGHLNTRLKLMATDMIEAVAQRVVHAAQQFLKDAKVDFQYMTDREICVMLNVFSSARTQAEHLCVDENAILEEYRYHNTASHVLDVAESTVCELISNKLSTIMDDILKKLARLDHGKITSYVFSVVQNSEETADKFIEFILSNLGNFRKFIRQKRLLDFVSKVIWDKHCQMWCDWLVERQDLPLHMQQFNVLSCIIEASRRLFEDQGLTEAVLETEQFRAAYSKLQTEKAVLDLTESSMLSREVKMEESYKSKSSTSENEDYL